MSAENFIASPGVKQEKTGSRGGRDAIGVDTVPAPRPWSTSRKMIFRVLFIMVVIFAIPWDIGFYQRLFNLDLAEVTYRDFNSVFNFYNPQFVNVFSESGFFGIASYINFALIFLVALTGAAAWTLIDKRSAGYNRLYYWARVLARYRVAYGAIAWGYKKIFIMQMPAPNTGMLHTKFIDLFAKRLYWEAIGIVPWYEVFLGFAEFIPGILLLFRRTTTLGAALAFVVLGNVAIANHAYDIGEQVPAACLALLSLFILWYDLPAIWNLLYKERNTRVLHYYPSFPVRWQRYARLAIKYTANLVFVVLFFVYEVYGYAHNDFYKIPNTPGLAGAKGHYHVTEFKLNNKLLPYSPLDTIRWHDATFEEWSSLSFAIAGRPDEIEMQAASSYPRRGEVYDGKWRLTLLGDERRFSVGERRKDTTIRDLRVRWELSGVGSDRKWYYYKADTINQILYLQNKNRANKQQKQVLHYSRPTTSRIVLWGTNEFNDSIYVVLDRNDKTYPIYTERKQPVSTIY